MSLRNVRYLVFPLYASVILTLLKYRHTEVYSTYSLSKNLLYWNYVNNPWQIFQQEKPSSNKTSFYYQYILSIDTYRGLGGTLVSGTQKIVAWFLSNYTQLKNSFLSIKVSVGLYRWRFSYFYQCIDKKFPFTSLYIRNSLL